MLADRYPSNIGPLFNDEYEAVRLKDVSASTLISKKLCDPYVMGYVPTEKYPGNFFFNFTSLSSNQRTITFTNILAQKNIGWGFAIVGSYSSGKPNLLAITNSNTLYNSSSSPNSDCIVVINRVQMAKMCARATRILCTLAGLFMPIEDEPSDDAVFFSNSLSRWVNLTLNIDISDYKAMMESAGSENPTRFRFYINIDGSNRYFNICDDDFNDFNIAKLHDENNEYTLYCTIRHFTVNEDRSYYGYNGTSAEVRCTQFFRIPLTEDNTENLNTDICACFMPFYGYSNDWRILYNTDTDTLSIGGTSSAWRIAGYDIGNYPYTIDLDELQSITGFNYNHDGIIYGKYLLNQTGYGTGYWSFRFYSQNRLSDGWKQYILYHKSFVDGESYSSSDYPKYNGKFEVSLFDENDTPLLTREPTLSSYPEMYDKLRPWQKLEADITIDDFDPADIPEWTPPAPSEEEDGDGDTILPPSMSGIGDLSGFVTMYALIDDQLANLGNALWSSYTDANFWNSVSVVLSNTTSIDPSTILNYIVSIRLFPFNLATVEGASAELPEIFFGRGLVGLLLDPSLASRVYVLNKCVTRIDGGVLDVPAKYGDFRDMEPCAKMILHVPFAGSCEINPSQVVGKHLALSYSIDFCTGAFMAQCFVGGDGLGMSYPVATLYGQLGATVQLSASNEMEALQCLAGASMGIASGLMGNVSGMMSGAVGVATSLANNRTIPHTTGKSAGFSSFFEPRVPYIEIIYDKYYVPDNFAHTHGYACNTVSRIGDLHGYTVCKNVDTTGLSCETDERLSIKRILESGFFVD